MNHSSIPEEDARELDRLTNLMIKQFKRPGQPVNAGVFPSVRSILEEAYGLRKAPKTAPGEAKPSAEVPPPRYSRPTVAEVIDLSEKKGK